MTHEDWLALFIILFWIFSVIITAIFVYELIALIMDARDALKLYVLRG